MDDAELKHLRDRIRSLDLELAERAALRVDLARQIGERKRALGFPIVDFTQERSVLARAREAAAQRGLDPGVAEDLFVTLIRASVTAQDRDSVRHAATGAGKRAVVVGGAGRMGRWLVRFLSDLGYEVGAHDPAAPPQEDAWAREALPEADLVLCSVPPAAVADLYAGWIRRPPAGVVADIASIKTPLVGPVRDLQKAGGRVASLHPLFGPSTVLLRDSDVIVCDTGDAEATAAVEELFLPTTARLVRMPLDDHDRVMADLLSLAHAAAIAFALALPPTGHPVRSTTFRALERLAAAVVRESPDVYYEIQSRNPYSAAALERLRSGLDRLVNAVGAGDATAFTALFAEGRGKTGDPAAGGESGGGADAEAPAARRSGRGGEAEAS